MMILQLHLNCFMCEKSVGACMSNMRSPRCCSTFSSRRQSEKRREGDVSTPAGASVAPRTKSRIHIVRRAIWGPGFSLKTHNLSPSHEDISPVPTHSHPEHNHTDGGDLLTHLQVVLVEMKCSRRPSSPPVTCEVSRFVMHLRWMNGPQLLQFKGVS